MHKCLWEYSELTGLECIPFKLFTIYIFAMREKQEAFAVTQVQLCYIPLAYGPYP